jgi:hypothetical protein
MQIEEDSTFPDYLRLLPTQSAKIPSPEGQKQPKINPTQNAIATLLLLLKTIEKYRLKEGSFFTCSFLCFIRKF